MKKNQDQMVVVDEGRERKINAWNKKESIKILIEIFQKRTTGNHKLLSTFGTLKLIEVTFQDIIHSLSHISKFKGISKSPGEIRIHECLG